MEFFGDRVERISELDPLRGGKPRAVEKATVYPASHYATGESERYDAIAAIRAELRERLAELRAAGKAVEAQRLESRTL